MRCLAFRVRAEKLEGSNDGRARISFFITVVQYMPWPWSLAHWSSAEE